MLSSPGVGGERMQPARYGRPQAAPMAPAPKSGRPSCHLTTTRLRLVARPQLAAEVRGAGPWERGSPARRFAPVANPPLKRGNDGLDNRNLPAGRSGDVHAGAVSRADEGARA